MMPMTIYGRAAAKKEKKSMTKKVAQQWLKVEKPLYFAQVAREADAVIVAATFHVAWKKAAGNNYDYVLQTFL